MLAGVEARLEDLDRVLKETNSHRQSFLTDKVQSLNKWIIQVSIDLRITIFQDLKESQFVIGSKDESNLSLPELVQLWRNSWSYGSRMLDASLRYSTGMSKFLDLTNIIIYLLDFVSRDCHEKMTLAPKCVGNKKSTSTYLYETLW